MIVLGSGGHTAEMLGFVGTLDLDKYTPRCYVVANTDLGVNSSESKAVAFERQMGNRGDFRVVRIPRSREVGQSYVTSLFTTLRSLVSSCVLVWMERPDLVLTNGPGTCVPVVLANYPLRMIGRRNFLVFSESIACVDHLSVSGKILYHLVDLFFVQWTDLLKRYPDAIYSGRIEGNESKSLPIHEGKRKGYVFVTVGSTSFNQLIEYVDRLEFLDLIQTMGFDGVHIQYGRGTYVPKCCLENNNFETLHFRFKDSLKEEMENASLIISHAGAGSILESLSNRKHLVVVPNESLMNNHQLQLAYRLAFEGYLRCASLEGIERLETVVQQKETLKQFPTAETNVFHTRIDAMMQ